MTRERRDINHPNTHTLEEGNVESFAERLQAIGMDTKTEYSINEFAAISGYQPVWIRRAIIQGRRAAEKKLVQTRTGVKLAWRIPHSVCLAWYNYQQEKQERKLERLAGYSQSRRPSEMACDMITRKVSEDTNLTDRQREKFLACIETYRGEWQEAYKERQEKIEANATT